MKREEMRLPFCMGASLAIMLLKMLLTLKGYGMKNSPVIEQSDARF